ncbi:PepSY-associated TM helix domain-containing protein [Rhizorhapis sp. SPR117]|uniref:PepSY-associated TM helix domain-containing protein n=1 Tax=Rhizorhapis sp. SPR117 TaxID=2912611 RepID=UPI001F368C68|nr:PepSY-associated TM helix domain-containing protein [Rhizorhapis sp. SPR117]
MTRFRLNQSGLLFVPARWQRASVVRWLKKVHAWTGFWGAILFFLLGLSGALLNHRSIWKIDTGEAVEVSAMDIAIDPARVPDEKALTGWAAKELGVRTKPRAERPGGDAQGKGDGKGERKRFMGVQREEAEKWVQRFNQPNGRLTVEYVPGSRSVSVRQEANNIFGVIKNLHKGSGLGLAWVLFIDTIAGALVAMSLTGFLLWTRLHGSRLLAGGIMLASLMFAASAAGPYML